MYEILLLMPLWIIALIYWRNSRREQLHRQSMRIFADNLMEIVRMKLLTTDGIDLSHLADDLDSMLTKAFNYESGLVKPPSESDQPLEPSED